MCGDTGRIRFDRKKVSPDLLEDLIRLQNRGRDATGFVTGYSYRRTPYMPWKKLGSAGSLFGKESGEKAEALIKKHPGNVGIGHVRYTTAGERNNKATQPHGFKHGGRSVVLASNGDIPFYKKIRRRLERSRHCRFASKCDAELLVNLVGVRIFEDDEDEIDAFANVGKSLKAAFSVTAITPSGKLLGMRDPWGVRPLFWAKNSVGAMICSESAIMDDFEDIYELPPGHLVVISDDGTVEVRKFREERRHFCLMEPFYFSRPDSMLSGITYDEWRYRLGEEAALEWIGNGYPKPDIVIPMPYSGVPSAEGCAHTLGAPIRNAVVKDRFGGRIFMFDQMARVELLRSNIKVIAAMVKGKRVLVVDDSIVRSDQSTVVIELLFEAGAEEVYFISIAPPYRYSCFLGMNTPDTSKLAARGRSVEEVRQKIGATILHYLSLEATFRALGRDDFCTGCFVGASGYPVPVPKDGVEA